MKPGNRSIFGKVPIPAAETSEDEASVNLFSTRPASGEFFCCNYTFRRNPKCIIFSLPNP